MLQNKEGAKLSKKELELWATTTWAIWNARNKAYFEKVQTQPKVILDLRSSNIAGDILDALGHSSKHDYGAERSSLFCWFRGKPCMFFLHNLYG